MTHTRRWILAAGAAASTLSWTAPFAFADGPPPQTPALPKSSTNKKKKKTTTPKSSAEVVRLINRCALQIPVLCLTIEAQMKVVTNCYKKMIADCERKLKSKKLSARERANIEALHGKLRKEYNRLLEISTGKSAKFVHQRHKHNFDSFCKKAKKFADDAKKDGADYKKASRKSTQKAEVKSAMKNLKTATRIMRQALDTFYKQARKNEKSLKKVLKADGAKSIYTPTKVKRIDSALNKLANRTSAIFNANRKIDELRAFSR